ncbi:DEAD/DEAH box helicase [Winogradskyella sediminis]|uniref:Superfamily I DNA and/or RNA helicase n=1 Tax=Winogradskyella sediminis TaxID=1382466 RepID=A0A1H1X573_9FLAO|nr:AAA domain-containing protein [Winogradskyella sediminis]SDT04240.1 Superfamily I DNA and/or RNA helicase [Winogradskyella sediminis]
MSQKRIWKEYISAQSKILEHKSKPIGIDNSNTVQFNGLKLNLSIDQEIFKQVFKKEVEQIFNIKDFNFNSGYIQTSVENTANIANEQLTKLKELSEKCYIDFNENPVIEGTITKRGNNIKKQLEKVVGELPTNYHFKNSGLLFLTLDEWKKIIEIEGIKLERQIGAVFSIKPSVSYIISTFYKKLDITQQGNRITIVGELHKNIFDLFQKHFGLSYRSNELIFKFQNAEGLQDKVKKLEEKGVELPKPQESIMTFKYGVGFYKKNQSDLNFEAFRLKRALKRYFPDNPFELSYTTDYSFDFALMDNGADELDRNEEAFWNELYTKIHGEDFQVSRSRRTISFDFETEEELIQNTNFVKSFSICDTSDYGDNHKYKFNIKFETGLHELQANLKKEFPNLNTKLIGNGEKLIFRQFYRTGNKTEILARLHNQLDNFIDSENFDYSIPPSHTFQEKYLCEENFELKIEQEEEKLSKLLRTDFYFGTPKERMYLGRLLKVDYPDLYFVVDEERINEVQENVSDETIKAVFPDLKGEKDKIKRLEDTVLKLDSEQELPNNNAKEFLYDSSKAKGIENIDNLLNKTSSEWQEFEDNLFSESLNESQKQAIYKSLYAEELALIQGPPGTGKSTAIAEIIWQHIRKEQNQKILLTSETNLAVDNAIDRLKNSQNNLVKPIRFGNEEKLDSEGYFYSLSAIESWENGKEDEKNTVAYWIENISNRIINQENEQIDSALEKWKIHLQKPDTKTRNLFTNTYLEYVNLIGATGSSIGKQNSEDKWTSFFRSYLNVFSRKNYAEKNYRALNSINISFDNVIMDEASKATPPELALPVVYGKKAIIVGDHRQLPPMIDGEEIKDLLISIGERKLAKTLSQREFEISQFERLFLNIDESIKGTFDTQYRMHPAINDAIAQFYKDDGGLKCGLPIEEAYHNSFDNWDSRYHGLSFENIVTPETHTIWINVNAPEIKEGTSRVNFGEIEAIDNILTVLKNSKGKNEFDEWLSTQSIEEKQIGLISFYGKQIHYINKMLKEKHNETPIRLSTVDRFQGMERNIIIVSMVRSNKIASFQEQEADFDLYPDLGYPQQDSLGFAQSPNRLNVALSRARRLLIVVGNGEHFCRKDIYKNVFETIQKNGKIIDYDELQKVVEQYG